MEEALGVPEASRNPTYQASNFTGKPLAPYPQVNFDIPVMNAGERADYERAKNEGTYRQDLYDSMNAARVAALKRGYDAPLQIHVDDYHSPIRYGAAEDNPVKR